MNEVKKPIFLSGPLNSYKFKPTWLDRLFDKLMGYGTLKAILALQGDLSRIEGRLYILENPIISKQINSISEIISKHVPKAKPKPKRVRSAKS